ncbi:MAG: diguanylate cyclase domain-containing protein [Candidatus Dormibacteria bacterium]
MPSAPSASSHANVIRLSDAQRLFAFATVLGLAGAGLWLGLLHDATRPIVTVSLPWWAELAACYVAGLLVVEIGTPRRFSVSLAEVPVAFGLFVVDPWVLLGTYAVGGLLARWTRHGLSPARDYGNLMLDVPYVAVAVLVFAAAHPSPTDALTLRSVLALAVAMVVAGAVLAPAALAASVAVYRGSLRAGAVISEFLTQAAGTVLSTCFALILLVLAEVHPWLAAAALPPALLVIAVQRSADGARHRAERAVFLHRVGDILGRPATLDERAEALLTAVDGAFETGRAELVLCAGPGSSAARYVLSDGGVRWARGDLSAAELEALRLPQLRAVAVRAGDTMNPLSPIATERKLQSCTVLPIRGAERTSGLLVLQRGELSRRDLEDLAAAADFIGAAADRGDMMPPERRRGLAGARQRGGAPLTVLDREEFIEALTETLSRVAATRRPAAVVLVDLDAFLGIRGTYGDSVGQTVLNDVARRLQRLLRRYDIVCRLGPDQLGLLLEGLRDRNDAEIVGRRILEALQRAVKLGGESVTVDASVGIAVVDERDDVPAAEELLRRADMAVYLAKRQADTRCLVFDSGSRDSVIASIPALRP